MSPHTFALHKLRAHTPYRSSPSEECGLPFRLGVTSVVLCEAAAAGGGGAGGPQCVDDLFLKPLYSSAGSEPGTATFAAPLARCNPRRFLTVI